MADSEVKKLLAKLVLDKSQFDQNLKGVQAQLVEMQQRMLKDEERQKRSAADHTAVIRKQGQQQKEVSDQQTGSDKRQIESLQKAKQALGEITQAEVKLKAQIDLGSIALGTQIKKYQDINAQCEIEMQRQTRIRTGSIEESRILSTITAQHQKNLTLLEKAQILQTRRVPLVGATGTQLGITAPQAVGADAQEAALALRLRMNQGEALSNAQILAERKAIAVQAEKDLNILRQKGPLNDLDKRKQAELLTFHERITSQIKQQELADQRVVTQESRRAQIAQQLKDRQAIAATRLVVSPQNQEIARLRAQAAELELAGSGKTMAIHQRILTILNQQRAAIESKVNLDKADNAELNRNSAMRERESAIIAGRGGTGGGGGGGGILGSLGGGLAGGMGIGRLAAGVFSGVMMAQVVGSMVGGMVRSTVGLVENIGQLEHLRDTYEQLGKVKGTDTTKFLDQMRMATHDLVGEIPLLRFV